MSIDLSQFFEVFFDEAEEHLANLEALLLEMDIGAPDPEGLNAIFRAAHSVKGGAGTFGFTDLIAVTHDLETLLDAVRKGTFHLSSDVVDLILEAGDLLKSIVLACRRGDETPLAIREDMSRRLQECMQGRTSTSHVAADSSLSAHLPRTIDSGPSFVDIQTGVACDWERLLEQFANAPNVRVLSFPLEIDSTDPLRVEVSGSEGDKQAFLDSLAFVVSPEYVRVLDFDPRESHEDGVPEHKEQWGLFEATPTDEVVQEDWGLFEEAPAIAPAVIDLPVVTQSAWGLFEEERASEPAAYGIFSEEAAATQSDFTQEKNEGYGLFEPIVSLPVPSESIAISVPAAVAAPTEKVSASRTPSREPHEGKASGESSTIRVSVEKVDQLLDLVGELVITQSMLAQFGLDLEPVAHEKLLAGIIQLQRNTRELQEAVMSVRMMPIASVFNRFPRVVRDMASKLGKKVELKLVGEQTELDKGFIEKLADPLTHLVRNSLDHGIELPDIRRSRGKSETGTLTLSAFHEGGNIVIEVRDDGAGLHRDRILDKARERGLLVSETMTDAEVWNLIFEAGFSTAAVVSDISGRGVGMDVVRRNIQEMGGRIDIDSLTGIGTTMVLRLPLTLAILDGMSITVGPETYILPLTCIVESLQPLATDVRTVNGKNEVLQVRGEYLPLLRLHQLFDVEPVHFEPHKGLCMILEADKERVALLVDDLLGQQQVVVKNLETNYRRVQGISGATIMGDGRVALIIDVPAVISMTRYAEITEQEAKSNG